MSWDTVFFPDAPVIQPTYVTLMTALTYNEIGIPIMRPTCGSLMSIMLCVEAPSIRPRPYVCALVIAHMRSIASPGLALTFVPNATSIARPALTIDRDEAHRTGQASRWASRSAGSFAATLRRIASGDAASGAGTESRPDYSGRRRSCSSEGRARPRSEFADRGVSRGAGRRAVAPPRGAVRDIAPWRAAAPEAVAGCR